MLKFAHIAAAAENDVIGLEGQLPWNIPEDLKFFRDTTRGHAVIMGRKTYESLGKPLPHRLNIVVTRQVGFTSAAGVSVVPSLQAAYEVCRQHQSKWGDLVFIIGGGEIYQQSLKDVTLVYLTRVHGQYNGDAKYPKIDPTEFKEISRRECQGTPNYTFLTYERR